MSIPRTTHEWLQPLYNVLDGHASRPLQLSSPTGLIGVFGASGSRQWTGAGSTGSVSLGSATGTSFFDQRWNGGTGTNYYTNNDIVAAFKAFGWFKV